MSKAYRFCMMLMAAIASIAFSQTINITGTVLDSVSRQPIANAKVVVIDIPAITAATNTEGKFTLTGSATAIGLRNSKSLPARILVNGKALVLSGIGCDGLINIDLFNVDGQRIYHSEKTAHAGQSIAVDGVWNTPGLYYVKLRTGGGVQIIKCLLAGYTTTQAFSSTSYASTYLLKSAASHTVEISKSGYFAKQISVANDVSDAGTILLRLSTAPWDWVGVIGTGQSLSNGSGHNVVLISTSQPYKNIRLQDDGPDPKYPIDGRTTAIWSVVPLTEPNRPWVSGYGTCHLPPDNCQYPNNVFATGESPHSGMANTMSKIWLARTGSDYISAHTVVGVGGSLLIYLAKGSTSYLAGLSEARVYKSLAQTAGRTYGVGGIILTHGEADGNNQNYEAGVYQLWQNYNADIKAITGQTEDLVLFASQQSTCGYNTINNSGIQIWQSGVDYPGKIVCVGPKYQYSYSDGVHMNSGSYNRLGGKYGEIFDLVVNQHVNWKPLGPSSVTRSGAVITIAMNVPNPPLAWDTTLAAPHKSAHTAWANGRGFEVQNSTGELAISSVQIQGNSIVLTLAQTPAVLPLTLSYAAYQDNTGTMEGGTAGGAHGQLVDSDELVGSDAEALSVRVTQGSSQIIAAIPGAFIGRCPRDIVTGSGLSSGTIVIGNTQTTNSPTVSDTLMLSSKWTGITGTAQLSFHHDQRNYCVHFSMPVP
jgi:hypothetical protein